MEVLVPGHEYLLPDFLDVNDAQTLIFFRGPKENNVRSGTTNSGTTNEEVLKVLIDRMEFLDDILPSIHNFDAIDHLKKALQCLNYRTRDRKRRGVEGADAE